MPAELMPVTRTLDPQSPTTLFTMQRRDLRPCRDLLGGTQAMRLAAERYLPKKDMESDRSYTIRVNRAVLYNAFAQTLNYYRGQVFAREVALDAQDESIAPQALDWFKQWAENVNMCGRNLTVWAGEAFVSGLADGVFFCLIDFPHVETVTDNGRTLYRAADGTLRPKTAGADRLEGWRPYLVAIRADQVLDCRAEWHGGRRVITHFRYVETRFEASPASPWVLEQTQYVHAYWPDKWQVYKSTLPAGLSSSPMELVAEGRMSLDEIPLAVFRPGEARSDFTASPALIDLAWLNIMHWQATSDQRDLLAYARLPVWVATGVSQQLDERGRPVPMPFGPGHVIYLQTGGDVRSVGVDAASIEAGRQDLLDIEDKMAKYGLQIMQSQSRANMTATQIQRESREGNSQLKNWALDFQDFLENCMRLVGRWMDWPDGPSVKVNDNFAETAQLEYLFQLHDKGIIGRETLANLAVRLGILPDDFSYAQERDRLAQDMGDAANTPGGMQSLAQRLMG